MAFTNQYKKFLNPEVRVPRSEIRPRNIYRISTYKAGDPPTKSGQDTRYVFVIGKVDDKIHCIKLNDIRPTDFIQFLNKIRDKQYQIQNDQRLEVLVKKFSKDGRTLFESYIKNNSKIYSSKLGNYRTYILQNITNVWEIRFEEGFLREMFKEGSTIQSRRQDIKDEQSKDITPQERSPFPTTPDNENAQ